MVTISLERSIDWIIAVLGVLKAGAAYLPMEPSNPGERIALILADSEPVFVFTAMKIAQRLPGDRFYILLDEPETIEALSNQNPNNPETTTDSGRVSGFMA